MWRHTILAAMSSALIVGFSAVAANADVRPAAPLGAASQSPVVPVAQKGFGPGGHIGGHSGGMGGMRIGPNRAIRPFSGGSKPNFNAMRVKPNIGAVRPKGGWASGGNWNGIKHHRRHRGGFYPYFYSYPFYDYSYNYADDDDCYWSRRYRRWVCPEY